MRFFMYAAVLMLSVNLSAQSTFSHLHTKKPVVEGKLMGYDPIADAQLELTFTVVVPTPEHQEKNHLTPNADGSFRFELDSPLHFQQIWFSIGDYYFGELVVDQGLELSIDLPAIKQTPGNWWQEAVTYGGEDAALCELLNRFVQYRQSHKTEGDNKMQIMMDRKASLESKVERLQALQVAEKEMEAQFLEQHPSEWAWVLENERLSDFYGDLFVLHWGKPMPEEMQQKIQQHQPKLISNSAILGFYNYQGRWMTLLTPEESARNFAEVLPARLEDEQERERMIQFGHLMRQKNAGLEYDKERYKEEAKYFYQQYKSEIHQLTVDAFAEEVQTLQHPARDMVILLGGGEDIWERTYYVEQMLPQVVSPWCKSLMEAKWSVTKEKIKAVKEKLATIQVSTSTSSIGQNLGSLENGAEFYLAEHPKLDTLLAALRRSAKGKAVLLDIWATWCGPCIFDMKESKSNIKKLDEMDVEVIYICVSSGTDQNAWQKKATELDLGTKHIFLSDELSKQIMRYFELKGYPSHVFLDKQGKYHPNLVHSIRNVEFDKLKEKL